MASKKTQRAITAADVPHVFEDDCIRRLADLFAGHKIKISAEARHEIKLYIDWYRGALNLGPDTAAAFADATRFCAEARFIVVKARKDVTAAIYAPPALDPMHNAAVALSDHLVNSVGVDRVVSIFVGAERIDAPDAFPDELAQEIRDRLEQMLADLDWFASQLTAVRKYKRPLKRGPKARGRQFVEMVASVIKRDTGQRIKRPSSVVLPGSDKEGSPFELLKGIADVVGIGPGTVEEVVRVRQERRRRGEISRGKR
jgi:hypothetical protein